jgi:hypothetical protein
METTDMVARTKTKARATRGDNSTRAELYAETQRLEIKGCSRMSRDELAAVVRKAQAKEARKSARAALAPKPSKRVGTAQATA